jgi:hypothetical protein
LADGDEHVGDEDDVEVEDDEAQEDIAFDQEQDLIEQEEEEDEAAEAHAQAQAQARADSGVDATTPLQSLLLNLLEHRSAHQATQAGITDFLRILRRVEGVGHPALVAELPPTFDAAMTIVNPMLAECLRFDVCRNECHIFRGARSAETACPVCHAPRLDANNRPWMVFRFLPLAPRLKRLFGGEVHAAAPCVPLFHSPASVVYQCCLQSHRSQNTFGTPSTIARRSVTWRTFAMESCTRNLKQIWALAAT